MEQFQTEWRSATVSLPTKLSAIVRGKIIDLADRIQLDSIILIAELLPQVDAQFDVELKIIPAHNQEFLPAELEMILVDENGDAVMQAQARYKRLLPLTNSSTMAKFSRWMPV